MSPLNEGKANTHLTHLEELVLTQGPKGYDMARAFLLELLEELKGNVESGVKTSVKWDGAPAIFAGINPNNGKFFVGTKSIFNKEPKINYTPEDVQRNHGHAPGLVDKLTKALQYLPPLGIQKILQGDFMFDDEMISTIDVDGEPHYAFKPNTITYAAPVDSKLGQEIAESKFGIVFHTTYDSLDGGASFGADVSGLNKGPGVWVDDAYFTDDTGTVTLTEDEEAKVKELVAVADQVNEKINYDDLPMDLLNIYINSEIKGGQFLEDPADSLNGFMAWYQGRLEKRIDKLKSEKGKMRATQKGEEMLKSFNAKKDDILNLFKVSRLLFEAKNIFINKYNNAVYNTKHFIDDGSGDLLASNPEGYVAVDRVGNGVKFVDRLEFSKANFAVDKGSKFQQAEGLTVFWGDDGFSVTRSLLEWAANLPAVTTTNQHLYLQLQSGLPITSLIRKAADVKTALAEAISWGILAEKQRKQAKMKTPTGLFNTLDFTLTENVDEVVAVIAGGFKPPHRGHMEMVEHYSDMADRVKLFIGKNPREIQGDPQGRSVTAEQSAAIWQKYLNDAGLSDRVDVEIISGSPMKASYSVLEDAAPGQTILMGCGAKDTYFSPEALAKYTPAGVRATAAPCPNIVDPGTRKPYSATAVRDTIKNDDLESFSQFLPERSVGSAEEIFSLLGGGIQEMSSMAGGAVQGGVIGTGSKAGPWSGFDSKKFNRRQARDSRLRGAKEFIAEEDEIVNEVMNYLLGISVG